MCPAAGSPPRAAVEGTRGVIRFTRPTDTPVQQWAWPPVQVTNHDPAAPACFPTHGTPGTPRTVRAAPARSAPA
ncbi:hypothetical protein ACFU5Y_01040 [Streptomyces gardneri]|uniref:hypothetical protein n=1 Tax=Streptomyces gardneri TaxID=66892 RepID=UPI0036A7F266